MNCKLYTVVLATMIFISSCGPKISDAPRSDKNGTLQLTENTVVANLFPYSITAQTEITLVSQFHCGLLRFDTKTLEVVPGLAQRWETSSNGKLITFHLAKGACFQNDECYSGGNGPEITSKDVKFSFELLCTKDSSNSVYEIFMKDLLAGGNDFYNKKVNTLNCFKIIDDSTFTIELENPSLSFLKILAHPSIAIINEIAYKKYGKNLKNGAGPFIYNPTSTPEKIILTRNNNYFERDENGFSLPYLDTVVMTILPSIEESLILYEKNKIDLVNALPSVRVREIVEKNIKEFSAKPPKSILKHEAEMLTQYYTFNTKRVPFDNKKVRQAISHVIDKEKIVADILQGQAISAGNFGITPSIFNGYDVRNIHSCEYDIEKAKKLLSEAGYPNGKGFPDISLLINSGSSRNSNVLFEIQKQLKSNLNINLAFDGLPYKDKIMLQKKGKADMYRDGWTADYPSPETFLNLFYGKNVPSDPNGLSYPNTSRYQNTEYDSYFTKGRNAITKDSSYFYFMKAEQLLMDEAVVIPLWYEGTYRLLNFKVKNLELNSMRYYDLRKVYKEK